VDLQAVTREIAKSENITVAQSIADRALTLVRDNHEILPLNATAVPSSTSVPAQAQSEQTDSSTVVVVLTDDLCSTEGGQMFVKQFRSRLPIVKVFHVDEKSSAAREPAILAAAERATRVIALAEAVPSGGRTVRVNGQEAGSAALDEGLANLLAKLVNTGKSKTAVIAFGNPYIVTAIPEVQTYLCTFSNTTPSAISAVRALFGEITVQGHMPVTIPGIVERGSGLAASPVTSPAAVK
jgi:beta-N-acetylhexosaminidase